MDERGGWDKIIDKPVEQEMNTDGEEHPTFRVWLPIFMLPQPHRQSAPHLELACWYPLPSSLNAFGQRCVVLPHSRPSNDIAAIAPMTMMCR